MKIIDNMHVLLLKGGYGSERKVSLKSAEACSKAIKENGLKVTEIDISEINLNDLIQIEELGEKVQSKVFQTSGIRLSWELQRVGIK